MNSKRSSFANRNEDLDQTFRFDSKASYKPSKNKSSKVQNILQNLDFSQRTSQVVRCMEVKNQNILQLLEESDEQRLTQKGREPKKALWDFFARFEKESNPDITISDIEIPQKGISKTSEPEYTNNNIKSEIKPKRKRNQKSQQSIVNRSYHSYYEEKQQNQNSRYPKRLRVPTLKYWKGERCIYKNGKIVDIFRPTQRDQK